MGPRDAVRSVVHQDVVGEEALAVPGSQLRDDVTLAKRQHLLVIFAPKSG